MQKKRKLMIIGIDGASFDLVSEYIDAGVLPNLEKLATSGSFVPLISTTPPLTPVAWTTMVTGCNPGKHGIYYFVQGEPSSPFVVNRSDVKVPSIWELFSTSGVESGLFNVPWTFPPIKDTHFCISGIDSPKYDRRMFHPARLFDELNNII